MNLFGEETGRRIRRAVSNKNIPAPVNAPQTYIIGEGYRKSDIVGTWHCQDFASYFPGQQRWIQWHYSFRSSEELKQAMKRHGGATRVTTEQWAKIKEAIPQYQSDSKTPSVLP